MTTQNSQSTSIRPGTGTRITSTPQGFSVSNPNIGMSFNHPFRPVLVGAGGNAGLRFTKGTVDGFEPTIGGRAMSSATLKLSGSATSKTSESWAILEVTPNSKGVLDKDSKIKIVHGLAPGGMIGGTVGRQAVALITWKDGNPVVVWPLVFFNLRYVLKASTASEGQNRHFFL